MLQAYISELISHIELFQVISDIKIAVEQVDAQVLQRILLEL